MTTQATWERGAMQHVDIKIKRNARQWVRDLRARMGRRRWWRRRCIGPGLAHNATRVVICRRWVITSLRLRPPASSLHHRSPRDTRRRGPFLASGARRDSTLEKARPADLIVNCGRQNTRVGPPRCPPLSSRNFGAPWKKVAQDASQNGTARARYVPCDTKTGSETEAQ